MRPMGRRRMKARANLLAAVLVFSLASAAHGQRPEGSLALSPKTTMTEVGNAIMSPVCPGKLLINCPSGEGAQLRKLVRRKINAGETKEQIVRYFVDVYGVEVLPTPPAQGFFLTAWLLPFAGLLGGFGVFFVLVRSWLRRSEEAEEGPGGSRNMGEGPEAGSKDLEDRLRRELGEY